MTEKITLYSYGEGKDRRFVAKPSAGPAEEIFHKDALEAIEGYPEVSLSLTGGKQDVWVPVQFDNKNEDK